MTLPTDKYQPQHHIRMVTAASLFDGHDAAINIMRRIIQSTGDRASWSRRPCCRPGRRHCG